MRTRDWAASSAIASGEFVRIVEQKDASPDERAITRNQHGLLRVRRAVAVVGLERIRPNNKQNEYYLTDCPDPAQGGGQTGGGGASLRYRRGSASTRACNWPRVERSIQERAQEELMLAGVTIVLRR